MLTGKRYTYFLISNSYKVQEEIKRLPAGQFPEARNWTIGCWRFETSGGVETQAFGSRLVDYVDERLMVRIPRKEITTDDQERVRLDYADIRELISRDPFEIETDEGIFRTKQVLREGNELIVVLASGEQKRIHGDGARIPAPRVTPSYKEALRGHERDYPGCVKNRERPYKPAPIYAVDGKGLAYSFLRGCDDVDLNRSLSPSGNLHTYFPWYNALRAVPMRTIERWEFDKGWGPAFIL